MRGRFGSILLVLLLVPTLSFAQLSNEESCTSQGFNWLGESDYPGTYSFTSEVIGSAPTGWSVDESGGTFKTISVMKGHNRVMELYDNSGSAYTGVYNSILRDNGTFEFYFMTSNPSNWHALKLEDGTWDNSIYFAVDNGYFFYSDGINYDLHPCASNTWYHIKINFDADTNWHLWIDGVSIDGGEGFDFYGSPTEFDRIYFSTSESDSNYYLYFDAIGYSWDSNYELGDNTMAGCCGDDNFNDTFTSSYSGYCFQGDYYTDLDNARESCNSKSYTYLSKDWWNTAWKNRKTFNITEESGANLTDYQIQINPNTYNTSGLVASYHFSEDSAVVKDYSGSDNKGNLYANTIGLWSFEEGRGSTAYDASGYGNDISLNTMTDSDWISAVSGLGLDMDGSSDYLEVNPNTQLNDFTLVMWAKRDDDVSTTNLAQLVGGTSLSCLWDNSCSDSFHFAIRGGSFHFNTKNGGSWATQLDVGSPVQGQWYHMVATADVSTGERKVYVNGELMGSDTNYAGAVDLSGLRVGYAYGKYFNGDIDELAVYKKVLSDEEVKALFNSQKSRFTEYKEGYEGKGIGLEFDGVDDYVEIQGDDFYNLETGSILAWVKPVTGQIIISPLTDSSNNRQFNINLVNNGDGTFDVRVTSVNDAASVVFIAQTENYFNLNEWHQIVYTSLDGSGSFNLYVDAEIQTMSFSSGSETDFFLADAMLSSDDFQIGAKSDASYIHRNYFDGLIDEVLIYNRVLSSEEVNEMYHERKGRLDYADLRFVNESGNELSYYHEFDNNVWVKTPYLPAGSSQNISMYYNNKNANTKSSVSNTFDFYDDFEKDYLDLSKWEGDTSSASIVADAGENVLKITVNADAITKKVNTKKRFDKNVILETTSKITQSGVSGTSCEQNRFYFYKTDWNQDGIFAFNSPCNNYGRVYLYDSTGSYGASSTIPDVNWGSYGDFKIIRTSPTQSTYYINSNIASVTQATADVSNFTIALVCYEGYGWFKDVRVRGYASTEPTVTVNAQESLYGGNTGLVSYYNFENDNETIIKDSVSKNHGILYENTVALYHMDEYTGSSVNDATSFGNDGTIVGPTWTTNSVSGTALHFNRGTDVVNLPNLGVHTGDWTVSAWVYLDDWSAHHTIVTTKGGAGEQGVDFRILSTGSMYSESLSNIFQISSGVQLQTWTHVVLKREGNTLEGFVDAESIGTQTGTPVTGISGYKIGGYQEPGGSFDEVAIYDRALSDEEIEYLYNSHRAEFMEYSSGYKGNNQGLSFDGENDYFEITDDSSLDFGTDSFSITGWVKPSSIGALQIILSKRYGTSTIGYEVYIRDSGVISGLIQNGGSYSISTDDGLKLEEGEWTHFALVFDHDSHMIKRYVNGTLTGTQDSFSSGIDISDNDADLIFGKKPSNVDYLDGVLDEVRIYRRALSTNEVMELYELESNNYGCCGDDSVFDNFHAGSLGHTSKFCMNGEFIRTSLDNNQTLCTSNNNVWLQGLNNDWWDLDYNNRKEVLIVNPVGEDLNDYSVNLTINTNELINNNFLQEDCGDLRFANASGQEYSYWIESGCNTNNTKIWINVDYLPASSNLTLYAYYNNPIAGNGFLNNEGDLILSSGTYYVDDTRTTLLNSVYEGNNRINVQSTIGFLKNDQVMIIKLNGTNTGTFEFTPIKAVLEKELILSKNLRNNYSTSDGIVLIQKVPHYSSVTINGGILTAHSWDSNAGVIAFKTGSLTINSGLITANELGYFGGLSGTRGAQSSNEYVTTNGGGGGGGSGGHDGPGGSGGSGTSCTGNSGIKNPTGSIEDAGGDGCNGGGGGGAGGGWGNNGGGEASNGGGAGASQSSNDGQDGSSGTSGTGGGGGGGAGGRDSGGGGGGGKSYDAGINQAPLNLTTLFLGGGASAGAGGGGGGGAGDYETPTGGSGGSAIGTGGGAGSSTDGPADAGSSGANGNPGGGIIFIRAREIILSSQITANGGNGGAGGQGGDAEGCDSSGGTAAGAGGGGGGGQGGAGGSILIRSNYMDLGSSQITAIGGAGGGGGSGGWADTSCADRGGIGGTGGSGETGDNGKIRLDYSTKSGTTNPAAYEVSSIPYAVLTNENEESSTFIYSCCGDDGTSDNFYNGSISNTTHFCHQGYYTTQTIDANNSICSYYSYNYLTGEVTGNNTACCGDDGINEFFYNGSISNTTNFCHYGIYINHEIDADNPLCSYYGYNYLLGSGGGSNNYCCGDDAGSDNFFNGSISNTTFFCQSGYYTNQRIDDNRTICSEWGNNWMSGDLNYPGTYSFTNDKVDSDPDDWTVVEPGSSNVKVVSSIDNHFKVVEIDDQTTERTRMYQVITPQTSGSIEYWIMSDDASIHRAEIKTLTGGISGSTAFNVYLMDNEFGSWDGSSANIITSANDDTWYHVRVDFDTITHTIDVYINGNLEYENGDFINNVSNIDTILFDSDSTPTIKFWIDAVGYSWDENYEIGDNYTPKCCGDDAGSDNFFNGSISNTTHFCHQGYYTTQPIDANNSICSYYSYNYLTGEVTGNNTACCGDDGITEYFYNDSNAFGSACYYGNYYYNSLDESQTNCEAQNFTWITGDINYPGTYSFTSDSVGGDPGGWIVDETCGVVNVVSGLDGHNKVLNMSDNSNSDRNGIEQSLNSITSGVVEFFARVTDASKSQGFQFTLQKPGTNIAVSLATDDGVWKEYSSGAYNTIPSTIVLDNTWYHVKVDFECSTETYDLFIDGVQVLDDKSFRGSLTDITQIDFDTDSDTSGYEVYIDAIGYSWDSDYELGDNGLPRCCGDDNINDTFSNTTVQCLNGTYFEEPDSEPSVCESLGYDWLTGSIVGSDGPCCGDDGTEDFYNGTIGTTTHFCHHGVYVNNNIDEEIDICEEYFYDWITGSSTGDYPSCCGDDGVTDDFYNNSIGNTSNICLNGVFYNQELDKDREVCTGMGYEWINNVEPSSWAETDMNYKTSINVSEQSGNDLTNYQVTFFLNTSILISQGKMRTDCGDIRFYDSNANNLDYFVYECNSQNSKVWVNIPYLEANSENFIYMYYGNNSFTSQNNNSIFLLYEDFEDGNFNGWTSSGACISNWGLISSGAISGSYSMRFPSYCSSGGGANARLNNPVNLSNVELYSKIRITGGGGPPGCIHARPSTSARYVPGSEGYGKYGTSIYGCQWLWTIGEETILTPYTIYSGTIFNTISKFYGNDMWTLFYDTNYNLIESNYTTSNLLYGGIGLTATTWTGSSYSSDDFNHWDDIIVSSYVNPSPLIIIGEEVTKNINCCGDDSSGDDFYNNSMICDSGTIYECGVSDGVCPEDLGGITCIPSDPDCEITGPINPDYVYNLCVNATTDWTWFSSHRAGESPNCCGNNGTNDDWLSLMDCCYNGYSMLSGNNTNSLFCLNGYLYDCNNQVSDAGDVDTNKVTNDIIGNYYCAHNNTWIPVIEYKEESGLDAETEGVFVSGESYIGAIAFNIRNPTSEYQTYELELSYDRGYSHFTSTESNKMTVTVPPFTNFTNYIDVYPVIAGEVSYTLTMTNVNNPLDYVVEQFTISVAAAAGEDGGGFDVYTFDEVTIFEVLVKFLNQLLVLFK